MQKLHLVGFTTDLEGLIFTARKGSKSGGFTVPLDDQLVSVIEEAIRLRTNPGGAASPGVADTGQDAEAKGVELTRLRPRPQSALSPREIQARLRAGRSVAEVAAEAGVNEEWVARFAAPVLAERTQVVNQARLLSYAKARRGESAQPVGISVRWNLADKGVRVTDDEFDASWSAYHLHDHTWVVTFSFVHRGRMQLAEWQIDLREGVLLARNRLATVLGYRDPVQDASPAAELLIPEPPPRRRAPPKSTRAAGTRTGDASRGDGPVRARRGGPKAVTKGVPAKGAPAKAERAKAEPAKAEPAKAPAGKAPASKEPAAKAPAAKAPAAKTPAAKALAAKAPAAKAPAEKARPAAPAKSPTAGAGPAEPAARRPRTAAQAAAKRRGAGKQAAATRRASPTSIGGPPPGDASPAPSSGVGADRRAATPSKATAKDELARRRLELALADTEPQATAARRSPARKKPAPGTRTTERPLAAKLDAQQPRRPAARPRSRERRPGDRRPRPAASPGPGLDESEPVPEPFTSPPAATGGEPEPGLDVPPEAAGRPETSRVDPVADDWMIAPASPDEPGFDPGLDVDWSTPSADGEPDLGEPRVVTIRASRARPPVSDDEGDPSTARPLLRPATPAALPRRRRFGRGR